MTQNLAVLHPKLIPTPSEQILIDTIKREIEQSKLVAYWKTGQHIKKHLLKNKKRANYGDRLFPLLSAHLSIDKTTLYRSVQFFEEYPKIVDTCQQLTWSHMRLLLAVTDIEARHDFEKQAILKHLNVEDLKDLIRKSKGLPDKPDRPTVLSVSRDEPYIYLMRQAKKGLKIDLGFTVRIPAPIDDLKPETIVHVEKTGQSYRFIPAEPDVFPHYTYKAEVLGIIDGDTIWANVDLGFEVESEQKLRLRGVNTAEMDSLEGESAKDYVKAQLSQCPFIAIKTHARDKFDRYLVDVFYDKTESDFRTLIKKGTFLNQALLDKGYAMRYAD